jgi:fluoride exporter
MPVNVVGGALTTYSAFAVQAHERRLRGGLVVVLLTVPPALAACALGHALGQA